jgi:hypothetical protein
VPRIANTITVKNPKRYGYDIRLGNNLYRSAVGPGREMTIQSSNVEDGQINVKQNPEDFTSNLGRIYSRNNFSGGQGLDTAHRADGTPKDSTRFWDSKGVDVFHGDDETSYHIHLLNTTADKDVKGADTSFSSDNNYMARTTNGNIYVADGSTIYESTDDGENWTAMTATGLLYDITGIAPFGNTLYITTGTVGTTNTQFAHYEPGGHGWAIHNTGFTGGIFTGVWFVKDRLLVTANDGDAEYIWEGNPFLDSWSSAFPVGNPLHSVEPTHEFTSVIDAGAVILAGSTNHHVYSLKDVAGTLELKGQTEIPFEQIHSMAATEGIVFLGTKEETVSVGRFYRAELVVADDLYVLANRQLIKEFIVSGIDTTPHAMFVSRDSIYMGVNEGTNETNLWRYYLPTAGFARDLQTSGNGLVKGITQGDGKFIISVASSDVYKETSIYESQGYLIMSAADFFTAEHKQFVGAEISTFTMQNAVSAELYYSTKFEALDNPDDSSFTRALTQASGYGDEEKQIAEVARYVVGKIVLKSSDGLDTPKIKSIQFRALARPELVVAQIPINISDRVNRPNRKPIKVKGLGDALYASLRNLEGTSVTLEMYNPGEIIKGVVERISYPIQANVERGSVMHYAIITVRGTRQPVISDITSVMTPGISAFGIMRYGA